MKKLVVLLSIIIFALYPFTGTKSSAEEIKEKYDISQEMVEELQKKYDNIGEYLKDNFTSTEIEKIKNEYTKEYGEPLDMDEPITTLGIGIIATVIATALGTIIATIALKAIEPGIDWLTKQIQKDGGIIEVAKCRYVKVSGQTFNPKLRSNWVGQGYANARVRVKAVQEYSNRARISNITVDGIFGPATNNSIRALQRKMGIAADGVVGTTTWMKMGGVNHCIE